MNNPPKVILLNRMLGYDGLNTALKGHSGKSYGSLSRYSPEYKCHVVELSLAEYEAAREDLFKKMRHGMSGFFIWEPKLVLGEAAPTVMTGPVAVATPVAPVVTHLPATTVALATAAPVTPPDLPPRALRKAAKAAGGKVKRGGTREVLRPAMTGGNR